MLGITFFYLTIYLGIRILSGEGLTDAKKAKGIGYNQNYVDIYSCSWGPKDNGHNVEEAGVLTEAKLRQGAFEVHVILLCNRRFR